MKPVFVCLAFACLFSASAIADTIVVTTDRPPTEFNGRWIVDFPSQGACTYVSQATMTHCRWFHCWICQNPFGTAPFHGTVKRDGNGALQIGSFFGTLKFDGDKVDIDMAATCGERRGSGARAT